MIRDLETIILAGGAGTRLRGVVPHLPKPMAPVQGRPFLSILLAQLERQGIVRAILSVGHMADTIVSYYGSQFGSLAISYSRESEPLGTGGALRAAIPQLSGPRCLVFNGDSYLDLDLAAFARFHDQHQSEITLALKPMTDCSRYGLVSIDDQNRITGFREKSPDAGVGLINGGVYLLETKTLVTPWLSAHFSFEKDFLKQRAPQLHSFGYPSDTFFLDIGVPTDYAAAQNRPEFAP